MRENEPVLLVLSDYDGKLFLRKGDFYLRNVNIASCLEKIRSVSQPPSQLEIESRSLFASLLHI